MSVQPVTKDDLTHGIEQSESRLRGEIQQSESRLMQRIAEASEHTARVTMDRMDSLAGELAQQVGDELAERMGRELARHVQASSERTLDAVRSVDDQYRALPGQVAIVRGELDAPVHDDARHLGPPDAGGTGETKA